MENRNERRQLAEKIATQAAASEQGTPVTLSPEAIQRTLYELRVHQVELEMQNEELRRAQAELDAARARYFDLYDLAPVGYCILSEPGLILETNLTLSTLLGVARGALIKQPLSQFIFPGDQDLYYQQRKHLFVTGESQIFELRMTKKDGTPFWAHLAASTAQDINGAPVCRIALSDITTRKQAEEENAKLQAQLLQSQKMESLGTLAGGVAHDMNNVLGAILGMATAHIEAQPPDSPTYRAFDTIIQASTQGGRMVKRLLGFARQSPAEELELEINELLREEIRLLEHTVLSKVKLELDLAENLRPIKGDASALTHAVMNLCVNAVDAMPENGILTLRTRNISKPLRPRNGNDASSFNGTPLEWIEVIVEDTGTGMPKEILEKAMDPFFTTKGVGKGTGLGLSLVYSTVMAHKGQMEIQSEPGKGTCVALRFPAWNIQLKPHERNPALCTDAAATTLKVLAVDDDELIQCTMQALLEIMGHEAVLASNGEEALAKIEAGFQPDVVILDMNMPGMGGTATLQRLRALNPTVPVLLATGRVDQIATHVAATQPYVFLLSKPFSMQELRQKLETLRQAE